MAISHKTLKILILSANPMDRTKLRLDEEVREIKEGLRRAKNRDNFSIETSEAVGYRDIRRAILDHEPHILHFSGHGEGEEGLIFENDNGQAQYLDAKALAGLLNLLAEKIECVVLNACYSEIQARAIAKHINYVIGMSQAIGDKAAIEFSVGFYDALGAGKSIEFAYNLGCSAIQVAGIREHLIPKLLRKEPNISSSIESTSKEMTSKSNDENVNLNREINIDQGNYTENVGRDYNQNIYNNGDVIISPPEPKPQLILSVFIKSSLNDLLDFYNKNRIKSLVAIAVSLIFPIALSPLSNDLTKNALKHYSKKEYKASYFWVKIAKKLDKNNEKAINLLGNIYEDRLEYNSASKQYEEAASKGSIAGCNNKARVDLIRKKSLSKTELTELEKLLRESCLVQFYKKDLNDQKSKNTLYAIRKNLGWVQLLLSDYKNAEASLKEAVELNNKKEYKERSGIAHCLLAATLKANDNYKGNQEIKSEIITESENCILYTKETYIEEKKFYEQAKKNIQ